MITKKNDCDDFNDKTNKFFELDIKSFLRSSTHCLKYYGGLKL